MTKPNLHRIRAVILLLCLMTSIGFSQTDNKKSHAFRGKVEQINQASKGLTVNHPKIEGWMDAMTMMYVVDKPEVLKKIKVGDQIQATVYDGDYTLHDVEVVKGKK